MVVRGVIVAAVGVVAGLTGAFLQAVRWTPTWGSWTMPWGLILALILLVVLIRGAVWFVQSRWGGWLCFGTWLMATAVMAFESPSGDVALGSGTRPLFYVVLAGILGAFAATLPLPHRSRVAV